MAISKATKRILMQEVEKLNGRKKELQAKADELRDKRDRLIAEFQAINGRLSEIQADIDG